MVYLLYIHLGLGWVLRCNLNILDLYALSAVKVISRPSRDSSMYCPRPHSSHSNEVSWVVLHKPSVGKLLTTSLEFSIYSIVPDRP